PFYVTSEVQLQSELHAAGIVQQIAVAGDLSQIGIGQTGRRRVGAVAPRSNAEADAIKQGEGFPTEVEANLLGYAKFLWHRNVLIVVGELPELRVVAGGITNHTAGLRPEERRRLEESISLRIELTAGLRSSPSIVGGDIRRVAAGEDRDTRAAGESDGEPAAVILNIADSPSADQDGRQAAVEELLAAPEWQIVDQAQLEIVGDIVSANGFVECAVEVISAARKINRPEAVGVAHNL